MEKIEEIKKLFEDVVILIERERKLTYAESLNLYVYDKSRLYEEKLAEVKQKIEKLLQKDIALVNTAQVFFQNKSSWQKDECLFCGKKATFEAVVKEENVFCAIRYCGEEECRQQASRMAVESANAFMRSNHD